MDEWTVNAVVKKLFTNQNNRNSYNTIAFGIIAFLFSSTSHIYPKYLIPYPTYLLLLKFEHSHLCLNISVWVKTMSTLIKCRVLWSLILVYTITAGLSIQIIRLNMIICKVTENLSAYIHLSHVRKAIKYFWASVLFLYKTVLPNSETSWHLIASPIYD